MKVIAITLLLVLTSFSSFCQNSITKEEYRFMRLEFASVWEGKQEMKKGYYLHDTASLNVVGNKYDIKFVNLVRENNNSLVGTMSIIKNKSLNKVYYMALPVMSGGDLEYPLNDVFEKGGWDEQTKAAFLQGLAEYLMYSLDLKYLLYPVKKGRLR